MQKTCLIIPCYNEVNRLDIDEFLSFINKNTHIHYLFVNDGSKDNTIKILEKLKKNNPQKIKILNLLNNAGKAAAVRLGILKAYNEFDVEIIGFIDADLSTPFDQIGMLLSKFEASTLFVFGSRFQSLGTKIKRAKHRHFFGRIFATLASKIIGVNIYDTQCGAKFFKREVIKSLFEEPFLTKWIFDVELFIRLKLYSDKPIGLIAKEVPIKRWEDIQGSKIKLLDFANVPFGLLKIYFNSLSK